MEKVAAGITTSLDGYITGPNDGPGRGLGDGGERFDRWAYELASLRERQGIADGRTNRDAEVIPQQRAQVRRLYDPGHGRVAELDADPRQRRRGIDQAEAAAREEHRDHRQWRPGPVAAARRSNLRAPADDPSDHPRQREAPLRGWERSEVSEARRLEDV